jgi:hypothetical protein
VNLTQYRQVIPGMNRIVYELRNEVIYIHIVCDTRRNTQSLLTRRLLRVPWNSGPLSRLTHALRNSPPAAGNRTPRCSRRGRTGNTGSPCPRPPGCRRSGPICRGGRRRD